MSHDEQPPEHATASRPPMARMETHEWSSPRPAQRLHHSCGHSPDGEGCRGSDPISLGL
ncbi:hypothetical protein ABZ920_10655 [Streptomyces sp. NPDC046831]|uniref:hypothetical protein n=1 Tax=Streptomyces sp. NPDC046831 TaxID=3154805 RepID=UPI0033F7626E